MHVKKVVDIKLSWLLFIFTAITLSVAASAQNIGFEPDKGDWIIKGIKTNFSIESNDALQGKYCARIGSHVALMRQIEASPLSILQFNINVKCSSPTVKAYSFVRFYDSADKILLEYKNGPISSVTYQQTGIYTVTPPNTKYAMIGVERDSLDEGYIFAENFSMRAETVSEVKQYVTICDLDQYMRPFWKSDTIYNETVLLYSKNGQAASGKLLYYPSKILSVKSFDFNINYKSGTDYILKNNVISRTANSKMPFRADTSFDRKNDLAWYNLQSQWVLITYTHKGGWNGPIPLYKGHKMPKLMAKLKSRMPVTIVAYGMSITRGQDVSSYDKVSPYMPTYVDLFARELKNIYGYDDIRLYNAGLPGATVNWGADYASQYNNPLQPDLVIIDFGMNDFWRYSPVEFKGYIQTIISKVGSANPNTEFLLLSNMEFDPDYILHTDKNRAFYINNIRGYNTVLQQLETTGIINLDMTTLSHYLYQQKKAKDCMANPLHPNDYLARWYAQTLSSLFEK